MYFYLIANTQNKFNALGVVARFFLVSKFINIWVWLPKSFIIFNER